MVICKHIIRVKIGLRRMFLSVIGLFFFHLGIAQNEPLYTQYINNQLSFNPAYAGSNKMLCAQLTSRNQWLGFAGRPKTNAFTLHSPIFKKHMGGGFSFVDDRIGPVKQNSIYFDYAYQVRLSHDGYLSFGLKGGFDFFQFSLSEMGQVGVEDIAFQGYEDDMSLNFGFGVYYVSQQYYIGVGIPRLVRNSFKLDEQAVFDSRSFAYYLSAGGIFRVSDDFKYRPSFQSRIVLNSPLLMEIMNWGIYDDFLWFGLGYRLNDSFNLGVQYQVNHQVRIGYTYDYGIHEFGRYTSGTHELSISYDFRFRRKNVYSPRYF